MKNTIKVLWYIVVSAMVLTMFVLVTAKVFAHGEGECLKRQSGTVRLDNDGWVKIIDHLREADLKGFVHGHLYEYYDVDGNPTGKGTGYFSIYFDDDDEGNYFADCPTATPARRPPTRSRPSTPARRTSTPTTIEDTLKDELPDPDEEQDPPDDTSMIDKPVEAIVEAAPVELSYHEWTWLKGYNLVSFPVMREGIETVADLYQAYTYTLFNPPQDIIYVSIDGCWFGYNGQEGQIAGDVRITPYLGVLMLMDWSVLLTMRGIEQIGDGEVELMPGLNVVGLSELPSRYRVPSDFLSIDGIEVVMTTAWDDEKYMSDLRLIGRAGDPGDNPLYRGQAVILIATVQLTLDLSSGVLSAPMAPRSGTLATSWGSMKQ